MELGQQKMTGIAKWSSENRFWQGLRITLIFNYIYIYLTTEHEASIINALYLQI